jgi:hypothetical protein
MKSIYYFKECYKYNIAVGYNKGCAEALNKIGDHVPPAPTSAATRRGI